MSDEFHGTFFGKFNSYFQHIHLPDILLHHSRNTAYGSSALRSLHGHVSIHVTGISFVTPI